MFDFMNRKDPILSQDEGCTIPLTPGEDSGAAVWQGDFDPAIWCGPDNGNNTAVEQIVKAESGSVLVCVGGVLAGRRFPFLDDETKIGVDPAQCQIVLPLGTPGVSRRHMRFWIYEGRPSAMDLASTYGTTLNGQTMKPGLVYALNSGDVLKLGSHEQFQVE